MYHVSKMHMQIHWRPSPLCWPFQPEPQRKFSSIVETCTAANSPLRTVELQKETFKSKFLRFWQVSNLGIGDSLTSTSSYMAYCLTTTKRQLPSERKPLDSITTRSCKHCITDHMMESHSDVSHIKRHGWRSKKLMMVCAELTNSDPSSETDLEDLVIIGRRWSLTPSPMLSDTLHVRSMVTLPTKHHDIFIQSPLHGHSRCGEWMLSDLSDLQHPEDNASPWL